MIADTHAIERRSPMGEKFVGTCVLCGEEGLGMGDAMKPCSNPGGVTEDDALLVLGGDDCSQCGEHRTEHVLVNFADGPQTGETNLVCPTAVFSPGDGEWDGCPTDGVWPHGFDAEAAFDMFDKRLQVVESAAQNHMARLAALEGDDG